MARINDLVRLDTPPIDYSDFTPEMKRWMSDTIDSLNEALTILEDAINAIP